MFCVCQELDVKGLSKIVLFAVVECKTIGSKTNQPKKARCFFIAQSRRTFMFAVACPKILDCHRCTLLPLHFDCVKRGTQIVYGVVSYPADLDARVSLMHVWKGLA